MYRSLQSCVTDLENNGHLIRISEEVDPNLEMAAIHLRVHESGGPAILFENVKGTKYRCVSNLFGTMDRSKFMFRKTIKDVERLVKLKFDPSLILKNPNWLINAVEGGLNAWPTKSRSKFEEVSISDLPLIKHWPMDGGAFVTLPQVFSEDPDKPGWKGSNLGMYRIQLDGNDYELDKEIGLHYQLHRGIGVHQTKWDRRGEPFKVAVFVGGPPAHSFAAVMPLPEGVPELSFAGAIGGRSFRYFNQDGYTVSSDADFVILGEVHQGDVKPEGPFGDHLGYYSLAHDFPVMKVHKVLAKKDGIWPFTVVGRPPQEDTAFGNLIHEITGPAVPASIPGLHEVNAVDEAGVHPLLFAIGSERYTPYQKVERPQELLTIANSILGFGQMSLAKFLIIAEKNGKEDLSTSNAEQFLTHVLERIDLTRDLHFHTNTTIDTLDYSGDGLNTGSKLVMAAAGDPIRNLGRSKPQIEFPSNIENVELAMPGVLSISGPVFSSYEIVNAEMSDLEAKLESQSDLLSGFPLIVLSDDAAFTARTIANLLWVTFTRSNPSHDVYGVGSFTRNKHWGCTGPMIIDARIKPHHAPPLELDPEIEKRVDRLGEKEGSLHGII